MQRKPEQPELAETVANMTRWATSSAPVRVEPHTGRRDEVCDRVWLDRDL